MNWRIVQLDTSTKTHAIKTQLASALEGKYSVPPLSDLNWLLGEDTHNANYFVLLCESEREIMAYAVLRKQQRPVKLQLGEFILYRYPLERFELWSEPVNVSLPKEQLAESYTHFVEALGQLVNGAGRALSVEGLAVNSDFADALANASAFKTLHLTKPFQHQFINFPETFDQYLQSMSKRSRKSVQYSQRKLRKCFDVELYCCTDAQHFTRFLNDAVEVSKKTYQWNLLGLGLRDKEGLGRTLNKWKDFGQLRCYLLYCDATPVAFMLGYLYQHTYYYIDVGFDPDWSSHSVGSVLQMEVIEDLYEHVPGTQTFDFSVGFGEHKGRFGNAERLESNVLVFHSSIKTKGFILFYEGLQKFSNRLVSLSDKLGIKKRLKRLVRRLFSK